MGEGRVYPRRTPAHPRTFRIWYAAQGYQSSALMVFWNLSLQPDHLQFFSTLGLGMETLHFSATASPASINYH